MNPITFSSKHIPPSEANNHRRLNYGEAILIHLGNVKNSLTQATLTKKLAWSLSLLSTAPSRSGACPFHFRNTRKEVTLRAECISAQPGKEISLRAAAPKEKLLHDAVPCARAKSN